MNITLQTIADAPFEAIVSLICLAIALFAMGVVKKIHSDLIREFVDHNKFITSFKNWTTHRGHSVDDHAKSAKINDDINHELSRLLFSVEASRVGFFRFHNGSEFCTRDAIWKVSATHERCEQGISSELENIQDIKSSAMTQLIYPMFDPPQADKVDSPGVSRIIPNKCSDDGNCCSNNRAVFRVDPDKLHNSYTQTMLRRRGVEFAVMASILDWDDNVIGFILVEYCHDGFLTNDELQTTANLTRNTATDIFQILSTNIPTSE